MKTSLKITACLGLMLAMAGISGCTSQDWAYIASGLDDSYSGSPGYQPVCRWYDASESFSKDDISGYYQGICNSEFFTVTNHGGHHYDCEIILSGVRYQRQLPPYGNVELQQARSDNSRIGWDCNSRR